MTIEKVYDELYGIIENLKREIAAVAAGETSITITPALDSGTKVADYSIDNTSGSLYAPTPIVPAGIKFETTETEVGAVNGLPLYSRIFTGTWTETEHTTLYWMTTGINTVYNGIDKIFFATLETSDNITNTPIEANINNDEIRVGILTGGSRTYTKLYVLYTKAAPEPESEAKNTRTKKK